ncbi:MAG: FkbM family methyltransferase [Pseudomonadota bacterium]
MSLPVYVINRRIDTARFERFMASAANFDVMPIRVDALDAHRVDFPFVLYADLIGDHFWGSPEVKPGAIGCFLSHRRAWQRMIDEGHAYALICEDDAEFQRDPSGLADMAADLPDLDILFANGRLAAWCRAAGFNETASLREVLQNLSGLGGPATLELKATPGADCYLLSRSGAAKLLDRTAQQKITCGVDWAMIWSGTGPVDERMAAAFPEIGTLRRHDEPPPALNAQVAPNPVADPTPGPSVLKHSVSRPISEIVRRENRLAHVEAVSSIVLGDAVLNFASRSGPDPVMEAHRSGQIWDEPGLVALLQRFPDGGTFVDIGAHVGNHTVVMACLGGAARALAFEPNEEIHRLLRLNAEINGIAHRLELPNDPIALGSNSAPAWLIRNRRRSSETMVRREPPDGDDPDLVSVPMERGDDVLAGQHIDAIKVDTSGSEVDVIKGLRETLARERPLLLIDHATHAGARIEKLADENHYAVAETVPSGRKNRASSLLIPAARRDGAR